MFLALNVLGVGRRRGIGIRMWEQGNKNVQETVQDKKEKKNLEDSQELDYT